MTSTQGNKADPEFCGGQTPTKATQKSSPEAAVIPSIVICEPDFRNRQPRWPEADRRAPLAKPSRYAARALELMDSQYPYSQRPEVLSQQCDGEPIRKRQRLEERSSSWIDQALERARLERSISGNPDPFPFPGGYEPPPEEKGPLPMPVRQRQQSYQPFGPPDFSLFPAGGRHLSPHSQRSSSVNSATGFAGSPVPSNSTVVSATRFEGTPRGSSVGVSGLSELDLDSRDSPAGFAPPDHGDTTATFERIHDVACVELVARQTANPSRFERLPKKIFMRILMYCDYKAQILLKRCNYKFYHLVDLESIPWAKRTAMILQEERYNSDNFPKKAPKAKDGGDTASGNDGDDAGTSDGEGQSTNRNKRPQQKTKPDPMTLGRWGCYTCYKILPPHFFEGPLLEDDEGRTAKHQRKRGQEAVDTDKKVDMRVEYIQVLGIVPGQPVPDWLADVETQQKVTASDIATYVRQRMDTGVNCDDLRTYYQDINKETHLMAPLRGVTPVFVESSYGIPRINLDDSMPNTTSKDTMSRLKHPIAPKPSMLPFSSISAGEMPPGCETFRPLYCRGTNKRALRGDAEVGRHFYELCIPHGSKRDRNYLKLPNSRPAGRIVLPQKSSCDDAEYIERPIVEVDDVIALRRICIPCGTKYGVYRRDCNRKIVSKTGEGWWVCACLRVRQTGRCRGCPDCGKRTIY